MADRNGITVVGNKYDVFKDYVCYYGLLKANVGDDFKEQKNDYNNETKNETKTCSKYKSLSIIVMNVYFKQVFSTTETNYFYTSNIYVMIQQNITDNTNTILKHNIYRHSIHYAITKQNVIKICARFAFAANVSLTLLH